MPQPNLPLFSLYVIRHGETAWSKNGRHTSFTDLSLTDTGKKQAASLIEPLKNTLFSKVFCSPSKRAQETCSIAGFMPQAEISQDCAEWNYGDYEGLTLAEIQQKQPGWLIFKDGAPGGESPADIQIRANRLIKASTQHTGNIAIFSSAHFSRSLAACWIEQPILTGARLFLSTASISILGYEHAYRVIRSWNNTYDS